MQAKAITVLYGILPLNHYKKRGVDYSTFTLYSKPQPLTAGHLKFLQRLY